MKNQFGVLRGVSGIIVACSFYGCSTEYYRAETRLHSDGQIDRAVYQPVDGTPEKSRRAELWKGTRGVDEIEHGAWTGRIAEVAAWTGDEAAPYFAGWNRFASVDKIPDHFLVQSPDESRQGRLVRETSKVDLVFVTEHHWHETLTDIVTLDDMHIANRELADLYLSYIDDVLTEGLGDDYDHKPLIAWMKGEGKQWFVEMTNVYFEAGVLHLLDSDHEDVVKKQFEAVCARHGLKTLDKQSIDNFAEAKVRELVSRKDGKPVDAETVESLLIWLSLKEVKDRQGKTKKSPLEEIAKQVVATKYDGDKAFSRKKMAIASRIWGLYGPLTTPREFVYSLEMPGTIVETSGKLQADNATQWTFKASEAYPLGYHMRCRSLEPNVATTKKLLGGQPFKSRQSLLAFAEIVADNETLLAALKRCVQLQSMSPLENYRVNTEADDEPDSAAVVQIKRLWKLLKLPK